MFAPKKMDLEEPQVVQYDSGFTADQIHEITLAHSTLTKRDLVGQPVTLEEFRDIIVPFFRIKRVETFNLNVGKEKVKKERVAKEAKPKKLTKKQIEAKVLEIAFKKAKKEELTQEEDEFFNTHTNQLL